MKFIPTTMAGTYAIEIDRVEDERGFFARTFCRDEFTDKGLSPSLAQCSISFNARKGTLRGLHFQEKPHEEAKLVRCTRGAIYDVIVDIRRNSPTFRAWASFELTAENRKMLYLPQGLAHGFQTLEDNCEVFYQISETYHPEAVRGVRWNDPAFAIKWPIAVPFVSHRDASFADFDP